MTTLTISYRNSLETQRNNKATEMLKHEQNLETQRHNIAVENQARLELAQRQFEFNANFGQRLKEFAVTSNLEFQKQQEIERNNTANNAIGLLNANANLLGSQASMKSAGAAVLNAGVNLMEANEAARHNLANEQTNELNALTQRNNALDTAFMRRQELSQQATVERVRSATSVKTAEITSEAAKDARKYQANMILLSNLLGIGSKLVFPQNN